VSSPVERTAAANPITRRQGVGFALVVIGSALDGAALLSGALSVVTLGSTGPWRVAQVLVWAAVPWWSSALVVFALPARRGSLGWLTALVGVGNALFFAFAFKVFWFDPWNRRRHAPPPSAQTQAGPVSGPARPMADPGGGAEVGFRLQ